MLYDRAAIPGTTPRSVHSRNEDDMVGTTPTEALGSPAPPFDLPGTDDRRHTLASVRGANGTVVMFICNHCPYVKAVADKIVRDMTELRGHGIGSVAIMSNDPVAYPDDSFDNMKTFARKHAFTFPYVLDGTQEIARAYGAVCTPDFFGYDRDLKLVYRGRLDASGRSDDRTAARELFTAMRDVARTGKTSGVQHPSVGCSIKWQQG
jgi:peroxiredoxin